MGSSKKHKDKDRDHRDDKKSRKSKRKHRSRSRSRSPSPHEDFEFRRSKSRSLSPVTASRSQKRRQKEKRRHSGSDDSDVPIAKSSRYVEPAQESRSPSPPPKASGDSSSLSIEETNKLRAKLGLKPLQVNAPAPSRSAPPPPKPKQDELEEGEEPEFDEETLMRIRDEREKEGETFWKEKQDFVHAPAENLTAKIQATKLREKIALRKEKRRIESRLLETKGLADSDSDDDASAWVRKQKETAQQKLLAEKKAKELDELDSEFGVGELVETELVRHKSKAYTERDLKGMKVLHNQSRFQEGESVIMTLGDKGVLDEEDDVLINPNMVDDEKYEKNIESRKLRPELNGYNVFDEIEFDNEGNLKGKSVLEKYDDEIGGPKPKSTFVIGEDTSEEARRAKIREKMLRADRILESVDSSALKVASDFYTPDEMVQFKKPNKKKLRKVRKVLKADDLLQMDASNKPAPEGVINQRDLGSRKSSRRKNETAVVEIKQEPVDMEIDMEIDDFPSRPEVDVSDIRLEDEGDMDFQVALHKSRLLKQKEKIQKPRGANIEALLSTADDLPGPSSASGSIVLHATAEFCRTLGDVPGVEGSDIYGDEEMDFEREDKRSQIEERGTWNEVEIDETPVDITRPADAEESTILEQEPDVAVGLANALKVATNKGYLEKQTNKHGGPSKMRHLQAQHYSIEDKNYEEERFGKRDDRFLSGPIVDFSEKNNYKPDFKLEYTDEDGKPISAKEAFRILSHKFHGKGSGKNKVDKKRRKVDQEKLLQHMNSTDTPLNTLELLQQRQKETHSAYLVLSGSNKTTGASLSKTKH